MVEQARTFAHEVARRQEEAAEADREERFIAADPEVVRLGVAIGHFDEYEAARLAASDRYHAQDRARA